MGANAAEAEARRAAELAIAKYEQVAKLGPPRADAHYRAYTAARWYCAPTSRPPTRR